MDLVEAAVESLKHPEHFAYYGDLDEADGWGRAFGKHRDSDHMDNSNFDTVDQYMQEHFPEDWTTETASHFLVGWVEVGRVRVLKDPDLGISEDNITDAFKAICEFKEKVEEYPLLDEEDYSERERDDFESYIQGEAHYVWRKIDPHDERMQPDNFLEWLVQWCYEDAWRVDDLPSDWQDKAAEEYLHERAKNG